MEPSEKQTSMEGDQGGCPRVSCDKQRSQQSSAHMKQPRGLHSIIHQSSYQVQPENSKVHEPVIVAFSLCTVVSC